MSYAIRVQQSPGYVQAPDLLVKHFNSQQELQAVIGLADNKRRVEWIESLVIPVRTNTFGNFCKDFFLPGFINVALKTNGLVSKILLGIIMSVFDILTLPIRCLTVIPRVIYNAKHPKEAHPFYQYLVSNGVAAKDLNAGHVYLEMEKTENNLKTTQGMTLNFMQLPRYISAIRRHVSTMSVSAPVPQVEEAAG